MSVVSMERIVKRFDSQVVVAGVSLEVKSGELFTLLGPSGCGKTTLLRILAGFYRQEDGDLRFDGKLVNDLPAHQRNTGMVFQNYAVFPHLSVFENVAYGLRARKVPEKDLRAQVSKALDTVKLTEYANRQPSQLSGGQQQRVALARALVIQPQLLLMDEPLSNLDAKLRVEMRTEVRRLQREYGITTIYVTHDQEEALAISDRIAVMNKGVVEQVGTPREIYFKPRTAFVADFIGTTNFLPGTVKGGQVMVGGQCVAQRPGTADGPCTVAVRPESLRLEAGEVSLTGTLAEVTFLGNNTVITLRMEGDRHVEVRLTNTAQTPEPGSSVTVSFPAAAATVFGPGGEVLQ
ncbi:MAG TPA: ABC transporter ATP-binding protein [Symbiobacteriaceae bacterium]|nr:ABC transporter ATP-binding protein [Symbiobacteriaceae bacterium]